MANKSRLNVGNLIDAVGIYYSVAYGGSKILDTKLLRVCDDAQILFDKLTGTGQWSGSSAQKIARERIGSVLGSNEKIVVYGAWGLLGRKFKLDFDPNDCDYSDSRKKQLRELGERMRLAWKSEGFSLK